MVPTWTEIVLARAPFTEPTDKAVASASTAHSRMSSRTATPRTTAAKRVFMMSRLLKMCEITGIEVTDTAIPNTSATEVGTPLGPATACSGRDFARPRARRNGSAVPQASSHAVGLRFSLASTRRAAEPETNMRSSKPRL